MRARNAKPGLILQTVCSPEEHQVMQKVKRKVLPNFSFFLVEDPSDKHLYHFNSLHQKGRNKQKQIYQKDVCGI